MNTFLDPFYSRDIRPTDCFALILMSLSAGYQTTADTLRVTTFYLLSQPDCLAKVRAELATVPFDDNTPTSVYLTKLEKLPYFTAVISESLRLGIFAPRIIVKTPMITCIPQQVLEPLRAYSVSRRIFRLSILTLRHHPPPHRHQSRPYLQILLRLPTPLPPLKPQLFLPPPLHHT